MGGASEHQGGHNHDHSHSHGHDHGEGEGEGADGAHGHSHGGCADGEGSYSVGLHVAAIFVVLLASLIGTAIPLVGKYAPALRMPPFAFVVGKCMATGVVLVVATIHMINHAAIGFKEDCVPARFRESYDAYAFLLAVIAALIMHAVDVTVTAFVVGDEDAGAGAGAGEDGDKRVCEPHGDDVKAAACDVDDQGVVVGAGHRSSSHHHHWAVGPQPGKTQRLVSALFMEFAVTAHSLFIGLTLGIARDPETVTLIVALALHQLFEGLALGARIAESSMRLSLELLLALIFSFSAPLGTAVGVGVVAGARVSVAGVVFTLLQAISSAFCGGILLYLAFILLLGDFPSDMRRHAGPGAPHRGWRCLAMFAALWVGAGVMAGIGKWI
ncbi:putative ZIP Zinc transporter [Trypanosoma vivax]|nr:putative ZIP Zinc transporter [Trypanosoma vivax]